MPRMTDLDIDFISLVKKGANKQSIKIYKNEQIDEQASEDKEFRSFFSIIKSFFTKADTQEALPTDFNLMIGQVETEERIRQARWVLMDVLENVLNDTTITDKSSAIATEIDKFKAYILATIYTVGIAKALEEIKEIKEGENMKAEDIKKMLDDALTPIMEEIKVLKDEDIEVEEPKKEEEVDPVADAIEKAIAPLKEELEAIKKSRKASQSIVVEQQEKVEDEKIYLEAFRKAFEE